MPRKISPAPKQRTNGKTNGKHGSTNGKGLAHALEAPVLHLPTGSVTDHRERATVEEVVQALAGAMGVDHAFIRHVLHHGQEECGAYFRAGVPAEMAIAQICMTLAFIAHSVQMDGAKMASAVSQQLAMFYDATGRLSDRAHVFVDDWTAAGGRIIPVR